MDWTVSARCGLALLWCCAFFNGSTSGSEFQVPKADSQAEVQTFADSDSAITEEQDGKQTLAARIAELQDTIEEDQLQIQKLEKDLDDPQGEYAQAEMAFHQLNDEVQRLEEQLEKARENKSQQETDRLEKELSSLERQRKLAQDRFDLAIESRKTQRDELKLLKSKLKKDEDALAELTGDKDEPSASKESESTSPSSTSKSNDDASEKSASQPESSENETKDSSAEEEAMDSELREATEEAEEKEKEAKEAEEETKSIEGRISDLQKLVNQEQKELALAKKKVDQATAEQVSLQEEIARRQSEGADAQELADLRAALSSANQQLIKARAEVAEINDRLNDRRAELSSLQSEHILALHEAKLKQQDADAAEDRVEALRNPFAPRNIAQWILDHGIKLVGIFAGMFLLNRLASFFAIRSVKLVTASSGRGSTLERENRARTLVGVFQNAATVGIFISGSMMALEEIGANITVLMGGVAVIGLAVAFGAQNLIKDYFYGFVMLLENQYMLNDTIQIGSVSGQVERITLRMTVLRDANGVVHFIPNGTINSVSNETHGWSRAVCEVAIGYHEDMDQVIQLLKAISASLKADPTIGPLMIDEVQGPIIQRLGESSIELKLSVKTLPNKHGTIKQEWLRRIHRQFAEQGIAPPYPQQVQHSPKLEGTTTASSRLRVAS